MMRTIWVNQSKLLCAFILLLLLTACGASGPRIGRVYLQYKGTVSERHPRFTRPDPSSSLPEAERTNPYHRYRLKVEYSGWYAIESEQDFDGYLVLYKGEFNPNRLTQPLASNDDYLQSYSSTTDPAGRSRIRVELEADEVYSLITTSCGSAAPCGPSTGSFDTTITPIETPSFYTLPEPDKERFNITVRFVTDNLSDEQKAAFTDAAKRWEDIITGDLSDYVLYGPQALTEGALEVVGTIDDVLIDTSFAPRDGPNGVLGSAGPVLVRDEGTDNELLTVYGVMSFDSEEFDPGGFFEDPARYRDVILHEMGHVLGIGTLWEIQGLTEGILRSPPTVTPSLPNPDYNPRFTGQETVSAYQTLLQTAGKTSEETVPIANSGGPGNYNGHWRELVFDNELMTPYASGADLLSKLTAASLADLGYSVDLNSANINAYALPLAAELEQLAPTPLIYNEFSEFLRFSGTQGSTTASVENVDHYTLTSDDPNNPNSRHPANSTSGCETDDFAGFGVGNIALMQRGGCLFEDKIRNAVAAGASGILLFNQGEDATPARQGLFRPGASSPIPAVAISFDLGLDLADVAQSAELRMRMNTPAPASFGSNLLTRKDILPINEHLLSPTHALSPSGKWIALEKRP